MLVLVIAVSAGLSLLMMGAWAQQRLTGNAGWADAIWSFGLGAAGLAYALSPAPNMPWPGPRQVLVAALIAAWSLRLGIHLAVRTPHRPEDARYAELRREWGADFERRLFWFLQIQAAAAAFLALSVLLAARNPAPLGIGDAFGFALLGVAIAGEAISDRQLQRFRADPANRGSILESGLWRWSRHPNYFFEWLGWLAYPCFAIDLGSVHSWSWLALSGPVFMYWLLTHVSGIPLLEQQMLRTRGEAYRAYRDRTSAFFPLPPARCG